MDLKRVFSGRVLGLVGFILVVLFIGTAFNVKLEGMDDKPKKQGFVAKEGAEPKCKPDEIYDAAQQKCVKKQ